MARACERTTLRSRTVALVEVTAQVDELTDAVVTLVRHTNQALVTGEHALAKWVALADARIEAIARAIDRRSVTLLVDDDLDCLETRVLFGLLWRTLHLEKIAAAMVSAARGIMTQPALRPADVAALAIVGRAIEAMLSVCSSGGAGDLDLDDLDLVPEPGLEPVGDAYLHAADLAAALAPPDRRTSRH